MEERDRIAAVKAIPIPQYLLEAVPEIAPALNGIDLDLYDRPVCLCPVHSEKTPSFKWFENTNTCFCWGCGMGGDIINLHRRIMSSNEETELSFSEAVEYLYTRFIEGLDVLPNWMPDKAPSKAGALMFEHTVLHRASPRGYDLAEELSLLIRLGKLSGEQAAEFYQQQQRTRV